MVTSINSTSTTGTKNVRYFDPSEQIKEQMHTSHDHLLPGDPITKTKAALGKMGQAFTTYPAKGLKGDQNASFYEFLAMGAIPYIVGSLTMIGVFNAASTKFSPQSKHEAAKIGKKLGVGVVLYVLAKELAKKIIDTPVQLSTGVDLSQPYKKIVHELPPNGYEQGKTRVEYHKAFESVDFPRWDLFYSEGFEHGNRNEYFDKIAKKNGYGELHASDQEMKPKIKQLIVKAQTWKNLLGYTLAATAVGLASQTPWEELFTNKGGSNYQNVNKTKEADSVIVKKFKGIKAGASHLVSMVKRSAVQMWEGGATKNKAAGIFGKVLLLASAIGTVVGPIATIKGFKAKCEPKQVIDNSKRYYEA